MSDCLNRIDRAGGVETTGRRKERGDEISVAADDTDEQPGNNPVFSDRTHLLDRLQTNQAFYRLIDMLWRFKRKIGPYRDDNVRFGGIDPPVQAKRLPENSLNPVPDNRSFHFSADADADSVVPTPVGQIHQSESAAVQSFALPVDGVKFPVLPQQAFFRKTKTLQDFRRTDVFGLWPDER